jgi:ArsR family transcriptional regulator
MLSSATAPRADLFRLLGDEDRLRLLALCGEEELTVGELATLLRESQPQVSKKSQPLRDAGLLAARRDGARTLLRAAASQDPVVQAAIDEGHALCARDGSLARVAAVVAQRDEVSRRYFDQRAAAEPSASGVGATHVELVAWLPLFAPLLPGRALAIDLGAGEGSLLPLLSPLYERVIAVDRSPARLAQCGARIAAWGLANVRLREGDAADPDLAQEIAQRGGADLVVLARVLHHAPRPADVVVAAARLVRPGGHLVVVDFFPHEQETLREQGHVWLGFEPSKLRAFVMGAGLAVIAAGPLAGSNQPPLQLCLGHKPNRP